MSWLFSQALVAEYSADTSLAGELSAPLSGSHTQLAYLSHGKTTGFSRLSRFGMTCKPLTDALGEALLTSYLGDSRARTSARLELAQELQGGGRSGLWREMARIVGEVRPSLVFVENSPLLVGRGLAIVLGDLAALGYDAQWFCLSASDLGAPHQRDRIWIVGNAISDRCHARRKSNGQNVGNQSCATNEYTVQVANASGKRCRVSGRNKLLAEGKERPGIEYCGAPIVPNARIQRLQERHWIQPPKQESDSTATTYIRWPTEPDVGRVVNGMAARVDRLKALGNGQVPRVAATAFAMLSEN